MHRRNHPDPDTDNPILRALQGISEFRGRVGQGFKDTGSQLAHSAQILDQVSRYIGENPRDFLPIESDAKALTEDLPEAIYNRDPLGIGFSALSAIPLLPSVPKGALTPARGLIERGMRSVDAFSGMMDAGLDALVDNRVIRTIERAMGNLPANLKKLPKTVVGAQDVAVSAIEQLPGGRAAMLLPRAALDADMRLVGRLFGVDVDVSAARANAASQAELHGIVNRRVGNPHGTVPSELDIESYYLSLGLDPTTDPSQGLRDAVESEFRQMERAAPAKEAAEQRISDMLDQPLQLQEGRGPGLIAEEASTRSHSRPGFRKLHLVDEGVSDFMKRANQDALESNSPYSSIGSADNRIEDDLGANLGNINFYEGGSRLRTGGSDTPRGTRGFAINSSERIWVNYIDKYNVPNPATPEELHGLISQLLAPGAAARPIRGTVNVDMSRTNAEDFIAAFPAGRQPVATSPTYYNSKEPITSFGQPTNDAAKEAFRNSPARYNPDVRTRPSLALLQDAQARTAGIREAILSGDSEGATSLIRKLIDDRNKVPGRSGPIPSRPTPAAAPVAAPVAPAPSAILDPAAELRALIGGGGRFKEPPIGAPVTRADFNIGGNVASALDRLETGTKAIRKEDMELHALLNAIFKKKR